MFRCEWSSPDDKGASVGENVMNISAMCTVGPGLKHVGPHRNLTSKQLLFAILDGTIRATWKIH